MVLKNIKIAVLSILLTIFAVGQIILAFVFYKDGGNAFIRNTGWVVLLISGIFGWLPIYTFKKYGRTPEGKSYVHTAELVDKGIYAIVRHPQYLAGILMGAALYLIAQHWIVGLFGIVCIIIYIYSTFDEEKSSIEKFGNKYKKYMARVPGFNFIKGLIKILQNSNK